MLEIAILDTDKTPMWSVPGTTLFLSFQEPGPLKIDISKLTIDQKKIIAQDISRGVLLGKETEALFGAVSLNSDNPVYKGGNGSLAKSYSNIRLVRDTEEGYAVKVESKEKQPEFIPDPITIIDQRNKVLKEFLDKHVATVKKELPGRSLSELRILLDFESRDKNRASVVKLINLLISKAQAEVFNSIQKSNNPSIKVTDQNDLPKRYLENVTNVIESDFTDVEIQLGVKDNE